MPKENVPKTPMITEPLAEYSSRVALQRAEVQRQDKQSGQIAVLRLIVAAMFLLTAWLALWRNAIPSGALAIPVGAFIVLALYHDRLLRGLELARRAVRFYEHGIARIEDRWMGMGRWDYAIDDDSHLYAPDLDLFGKASLFDLLCTARTRAGVDTLAQWLCKPASKDEILSRQHAIEELRGNIDLRLDLAILGADLRSAIRPELTRWSEAPIVLGSTRSRWATRILTLLNVSGLVYYGVTDSAAPLLLILPVSILFATVHRRRVLSVLDAIEEPQRELGILGMALARLERERFQSPKLAGLQRALETTGRPASAEIARLLRIVALVDSRKNQFFRPISYFLMWATKLAFDVEAWRRDNAHAATRWLAAVGEVEALCALAGFAYEHPERLFPEIVEPGPILDAEQMRHPLLPASHCVPNSVHFFGELRLLVVSGSNMSGKSTLLRTAGINVVLALAGAPVCAARMRVSPMSIGATLRIQDSLQAGTSRFYAEIQRLRQIMELTRGTLPVLFLLDEILHGTNSHDRAIGAEGVVRGLVDRGAIGLVTTHDLALARVAEALSPRATNVHFKDHLENGRMVFDYRLQSGVVQKSNALELMRAVGLDV